MYTCDIKQSTNNRNNTGSDWPWVGKKSLRFVDKSIGVVIRRYG